MRGGKTDAKARPVTFVAVLLNQTGLGKNSPCFRKTANSVDVKSRKYFGKGERVLYWYFFVLVFGMYLFGILIDVQFCRCEVTKIFRKR
jgi:hypothetical protein